ncbi:MAG: toll/interleukin-1 receptor domain-containing protein [Verrucomicrobia bacterium]|nr:toll/interleukin-1 receptor domain-containing protein [Verrucomicrobiota bacterium]
MSTEFQYDVFLQPNQADKPRVRRLAERLRAAGLRVWFDEWVIQPGGSPRPSDGRGVRGEGLAIERGLEASCTLACPAEASARRRKRSAVGRGNLPFRDPANAGRRFIPLLLADCKLPNMLRLATPPAESPSAANSASTRRRNCRAKASNAPGRRPSRWMPQ